MPCENITYAIVSGGGVKYRYIPQLTWDAQVTSLYTNKRKGIFKSVVHVTHALIIAERLG